MQQARKWKCIAIHSLLVVTLLMHNIKKDQYNILKSEREREREREDLVQ